MTKRFTNHDDTIIDTDGEQLISTDEIVDKMNELHKENKELQGKYNAQRRLFGQLNSDYNNYRLSAEDCQKQLKEENEQIKQTIKDMMENERTELGKMTLRQLWRQI